MKQERFTSPSCRISHVLIYLFLQSFGLTNATAAKAFPTAEGMGKNASGGRGGRVIRVTNLNDSGPGSLRAAIDSSGARIVVFEVAGNIWLSEQLVIRNDDITIAGQTAPGEGICIAGATLMIKADNVIIRYLRVRPGDLIRKDVDAIHVSEGRDIIIDHCSASWSVDETLSVSSKPDRVTVQWCLISEGLHRSFHSSGDPHSKGSLVNGQHGARYSFHHNLYAHQSDRCPQFGNRLNVDQDPEGPLFDFRNNVIYNWGSPADGWEAAGQNRNKNSVSRYNFVNNAYVPGPTTAPAIKLFDTAPRIRYEYWAFEELCPLSKAHFSGNTMNGKLWEDDWKHVSIEVDVRSDYHQESPFSLQGFEVPTENAFDAYERVLESAGASYQRDAVDRRIVYDVREFSGGLIDSQYDVGGWPELDGGVLPVDSDGDGMPDEWEIVRGLNPSDGRDATRDRDGDGYTNIEEYIHGLVDDGFDFEITSSSSGEGKIIILGGDKLPKHSDAEIQIVAGSDWYISTVDLNGRDVTDDINGGRLRIQKIDQHIHVHARFEPHVTSANSTPIWWLRAQGVTEGFESASLGDWDGDGLQAWQEYRLGTDPRNPRSSTEMRIVHGPRMGFDERVLQIRFLRARNEFGVEAVVEFAQDAGSWDRIADSMYSIEVDPRDSRFEIAIIAMPDARQGFYRVRYEFE